MLRLAAGCAATSMLLACSPATHRLTTASSDASAMRQQYLRVPMAFEPNAGQIDGDAQFLARGPGYTLLLGPTGATFGLRSHGVSPTQRVGMSILGGNAAAVADAEARQSGTSNYFRGGRKAVTDVTHFGRVRYQGVYPGIDLVYYGNQQQLEYDFVVAPGADPGRIALAFNGMQDVRVDHDGNLLLTTPTGELVQKQPIVYQTVEGRRHAVSGRYRLLADHQVGIEVGRYDAKASLVIDPVLSYSSYFGGSGDEYIGSLTTDPLGNVYVTGGTASLDFPTAKPLRATNAGGAEDIFVAKFDPHTDSLIYSTYLGGSGDDYANAIAVDGAGNVYVSGSTTSTDFPSVGALQAHHASDSGQADGFVLKLNAGGSALGFSTYFGGNGADYAYVLTLDASGEPWIAGQTTSTDLPTKSPLQATNRGGKDGFIGKLTSSGALVSGTYLGGTGDDFVEGIAMDASGRPHVAGVTFSTDFPVVNATQPTLAGSADAFVSMLSADASALVYSSYLGGTSLDAARDLVVDGNGTTYVVGYTQSTDFPVTGNATQPSLTGGTGGVDAFFVQFGSDNRYAFSTYIGGSARDELREVSLRGSIPQAVGYTYSADFPLVHPVQSAFNRGSTSATGCELSTCSDAILVEFAPSGGGLRVSSYLGDTGDDKGWAIGAYGGRTFFVAGETNSADLPTAGALQPAIKGGIDGFLMRFGVPGADASYVHDMDGDFSADLIWRNPRTGANALWLDGNSATTRAVTTVPGPWAIAAVGDFNCDGISDLLWRNGSSGANTIWLSGNSATTRAVTGVSNVAWQVAGVADVQGQACAEDIVWHNASTGASVIWLSASATTTRSVTTVAADWDLLGVGDFDGDGRADDLLWHNHRTGASSIWKDSYSGTSLPVSTVTNLSWKIVGIGDFLGDGVSDILWRNTATGANVIWISGDSAKQQAVTGVTNLDWTVAAVGDYSGDGRSDLFWRNRRTGANVIWRSASSTHQQAVTGVTNVDWSVVP